MSRFSGWGRIWEKRALAAFIALGGTATGAIASVDYVRDAALPAYMGEGVGDIVLSISQAPLNAEGTNALPYLSDRWEYSALDLTTGEFVNPPPLFASDFRRSAFTLQTWVGGGSNGPVMIGLQGGKIYTYDFANDRTATGVESYIVYDDPHSLAALSLDAPFSLLAGGKHFTMDWATGAYAEMPLLGVDTATTNFMSYGADGFLYVLDYGHGRIAGFDPNNNFAFLPLKSFDLNTDLGTVTANEQFAIGINGSFYLSDGTGGGSYYDRLGTFKGTFHTGGAPGTGYNGQSYINTDASGAVIVYDAETGIHQYQDTSVTPVPEPSTYAVAIGGILLAVILRRRAIRSAR